MTFKITVHKLQKPHDARLLFCKSVEELYSIQGYVPFFKFVSWSTNHHTKKEGMLRIDGRGTTFQKPEIK
jgi:hypothetical protein